MTTYSHELLNWFQSPLGQHLLNSEMVHLQPILPHLFGFYLLQIGNIGQGQLLNSSRIIHRYLLDNPIGPPFDNSYSTLCAHPHQLPFAQDSIDVILLPHLLDYAEQPYLILEEVKRVLLPEGHLIILGFNKLSLWELTRWLPGRSQILPNKLSYSYPLREWLTSLNLEVIHHTSFFLACSLSKRLQNSLTNNSTYSTSTQDLPWLEKFAERWLYRFGAVYLLVVKKRITALTPIRPKWQVQKNLITEAVAPLKKTHEQ